MVLQLITITDKFKNKNMLKFPKKLILWKNIYSFHNFTPHSSQTPKNMLISCHQHLITTFK